jgi:phenylacetate-coenzyme A ligase PaaK-like adenylate-forming protein
LNRVSDSLYSAIYPRLPVLFQNWACTIGGWTRYQGRFSQHFHRTLSEWEKTEQWPTERLHELQRKRLDRLVRVAREAVPYYRDLPEPSTRSDPAEAMRELLGQIPPLEKRAYRDQPHAFI